MIGWEERIIGPDGQEKWLSSSKMPLRNEAGNTYTWSDERYSINGEAFARTSLQDFGDSYSIGGKLNVKW